MKILSEMLQCLYSNHLLHLHQVKVPGKQEDAWIMKHLIKQLTDMGFPVSSFYFIFAPEQMNLSHMITLI